MQLAFHVKELLVQLGEALHQLVGLAGLKELSCLGLGGALQLGPALADLTQLFPHGGCQLWLLLYQLLALLPQTGGRQKVSRRGQVVGRDREVRGQWDTGRDVETETGPEMEGTDAQEER